MKKIVIILSLYLTSMTLNAQITIINSDLPSKNDTIRYSNANIDTLITNNYAKTGPDYKWDFSKLSIASQGIDDYEAASSTAYYLYFFSKPGEFGQKIADSLNLSVITLYNIYNFYSITSSYYAEDAMGLTISTFPYAPSYKYNDIIYRLPLNYKNHDSNYFYFDLSLAGQMEYIRQGYRINDVDGWGSITTPYGTFNCLRIKSVIIETDSLKSSLLPNAIPIPNNQIEYKWLAKNEKIPILEISGSLQTTFTPTTVLYRDNYHHIVSPLGPKINFTANKLNTTVNDTVSFINNTSGILNSYTWSFNPKHVLYVKGTDSTSTNPIVLFTQAGNYDVTLKAINYFGNADTTKFSYIHIANSTGFASENSEKFKINAFPNPLKENSLVLDYKLLKSSEIKIQLLDLTGKTIAVLSESSESAGNHTHSFNIPEIICDKGILFIEVTGNDIYAIQKIVLN